MNRKVGGLGGGLKQPQTIQRIYQNLNGQKKNLFTISSPFLQNLKNKYDNIHKSEALKRYERRKLTLVKCQN